MNPEKGLLLTVEFSRIRPSDQYGMMNVTRDGSQGFYYCDIAPTHHGAQVAEGVDDERVLEFGAQLGKLIRQYFANVTPILDEPLNKHWNP